MPDWTFADLKRALPAAQILGNSDLPNPVISGFSIDSRSIKAGELFIAIIGERLDGHAFIRDALQQGASALLVQTEPADELLQQYPVPVLLVPDSLIALQDLARFHRQRHPGRFVGVTGSNGKTTSKEMLRLLWDGQRKTWATAGNFNNHIGLPLNLLRIPLDAEICIVEMGMSHSGEIRFLAEIAAPHSALITNVGPAHIGNLGTLENIALAKAEIIECLPSSGFAVLAGDSPFLPLMREKTTAQVFTFGLTSACDLYARNVQVTLAGSTFEVVSKAHDQTHDQTYNQAHDQAHNQAYNHTALLSLSLLGEHNVRNALGALALYLAEGGQFSAGCHLLQQFTAVGARMETHQIDDRDIIVDCYNANPASMHEALRYLSMAKARKIAVLGDMLELGEAAIPLHTEIGQAVTRAGVDLLLLAGPLAGHIAAGARQAGMHEDRIIYRPDPGQLVDELASRSKPGDVILFKASRGLHFEVIIQSLWPSIPLDLH